MLKIPMSDDLKFVRVMVLFFTDEFLKGLGLYKPEDQSDERDDNENLSNSEEQYSDGN